MSVELKGIGGPNVELHGNGQFVSITEQLDSKSLAQKMLCFCCKEEEDIRQRSYIYTDEDIDFSIAYKLSMTSVFIPFHKVSSISMNGSSEIEACCGCTRFNRCCGVLQSTANVVIGIRDGSSTKTTIIDTMDPKEAHMLYEIIKNGYRIASRQVNRVEDISSSSSSSSMFDMIKVPQIEYI